MRQVQGTVVEMQISIVAKRILQRLQLATEVAASREVALRTGLKVEGKKAVAPRKAAAPQTAAGQQCEEGADGERHQLTAEAVNKMTKEGLKRELKLLHVKRYGKLAKAQLVQLLLTNSSF
jgi:hypothetical protein